jgi:hypothetical protein
MTCFALMDSDQLNARLVSILGILQERAEIHITLVRDLSDEAACLAKVLNRRYSLNVDLDAVLADIDDATVHEIETATEH